MVVDDDEINSLTTLSFLEAYPFIEIKGVFDSPVSALAAARKLKPEAMFLDIDMPGMSGLELLRQLADIPACIFITSYPDYAVEGFELAALDFLVKPFSHERFLATIERLQEFIAIREKAELLNHTLGAETIFIKDGHNQVKLQLHEIMYFEALNNYTSIVTPTRKYAVLSTMNHLLGEKEFRNFIRIHRSYAVQKHFISKISAGKVWIRDIILHIGEPITESLKQIKL